MNRNLLLAALVLPGPAWAEIACPASITTPVAEAAGWIVEPHPSPTGFPFRGADAPGRKSFAGVTIVDGGAGDLRAEAPGSLVPDESAVRQGQLRQRWDLSAGSPRGFLMVCRYQGTATVLARVLPPATRDCVQLLSGPNATRALSARCQ